MILLTPSYSAQSCSASLSSCVHLSSNAGRSRWMLFSLLCSIMTVDRSFMLVTSSSVINKLDFSLIQIYCKHKYTNIHIVHISFTIIVVILEIDAYTCHFTHICSYTGEPREKSLWQERDHTYCVSTL